MSVLADLLRRFIFLAIIAAVLFGCFVVLTLLFATPVDEYRRPTEECKVWSKREFVDKDGTVYSFPDVCIEYNKIHKET